MLKKEKKKNKKKVNKRSSKNVKEKNYRYGILAFLTYIIGIILLANLFIERKLQVGLLKKLKWNL